MNNVKELKNILENNPNDVDALLNLGKYYYRESAEENSKIAAKECIRFLQKAFDLNNKNAEIVSWYGGSLTIKGRFSWFPISKLKWVKRGIEKMDQAVKMEPKNILVYKIRAFNNIYLPGFFGRLDIAINDFKYLLNQENNIPGSLSEDDHLGSYIHIGIGYQKKGNKKEANKMWQKVIDRYPDSEHAREAKELVEKYIK